MDHNDLPPANLRPWMGRWLLTVAALHTLFGLLLMPYSGFWLVLPAVWGLLRQRPDQRQPIQHGP